MAYRYSYRVALATEASADDMLDVLENSGFDVISVTAREVNTERITKGAIILEVIRREVAKPEGAIILTRMQIAAETNSTVGRVAEILKEYARLPEITAYIERVRGQRDMVKNQKALENAAARAAEKARKAAALADAAADAARAAAIARSAIENVGVTDSENAA